MKEVASYHSFLEDKAGLGLSEAYRHERMERVYKAACGLSEKSPSHDFHHIQLTLKYAEILLKEAKSFGLNPNSENVFLAVCCHDLGRSKRFLHGSRSLDESVLLATVVLKNRGYTEREAEAVCQIIRQHDQPENIPTSLEAKILKEADFLAGLGAWGILRTILWAGESGRDIEQIIQTLEERMPNRIASLEFATSKAIAWKEWPVVRLFLTSLKEQYSSKEVEVFPGKYIILEGISGSGKDAQAQMLAEYLKRANNLSVEIINEPSKLGRHTLGLWKNWDGILGEVTQEQRAFLMTADRVAISKEIKSALREGKVVLGVRSFVSTMVYQGETELMVAEIMFNNRFVPRPEVIIWLDLPAEEALGRIDKRLVIGGGKRGDFEEIEKARILRERYRKIFSLVFPVTQTVTINASLAAQDVHQNILTQLKKLKIVEL